MGIYVRAQKIAGGDRSGNRDGIFSGATAAIVRGYGREGRLPDVALHQA